MRGDSHSPSSVPVFPDTSPAQKRYPNKQELGDHLPETLPILSHTWAEGVTLVKLLRSRKHPRPVPPSPSHMSSSIRKRCVWLQVHKPQRGCSPTDKGAVLWHRGQRGGHRGERDLSVSKNQKPGVGREFSFYGLPKSLGATGVFERP